MKARLFVLIVSMYVVQAERALERAVDKLKAAAAETERAISTDADVAYAAECDANPKQLLGLKCRTVSEPQPWNDGSSVISIEKMTQGEQDHCSSCNTVQQACKLPLLNPEAV